MCGITFQRDYMLQIERGKKKFKMSSNMRRLKRIHEEQDGKCYWCGEEMNLWFEVDRKIYHKVFHRTATIEHLLPRSQGGTLHRSNIACACNDCNAKRSTIPHDHFKWVSSNPERYEKWKQLKEQRRIKEFKIKEANAKVRQAHFLFGLASLLFLLERYHNVRINHATL